MGQAPWVSALCLPLGHLGEFRDPATQASNGCLVLPLLVLKEREMVSVGTGKELVWLLS